MDRARGFTMVELLVVVLIMGVVSTGLYEILHRTRTSYDLQRWILEMQDNARIGLHSISDDFRHVSYGKDPTQPSIEYAGPDTVTFVADLRTEIPGAELISYFLAPGGDPDTPNPDDTILMKTMSDSGGVLIYESPQAYGIAEGGLQLRYFNGQGVELANPVPSPEQIGEIEILVTAVTPRKHKDGEYQDFTLSATVYPRNLPLSPARSRPSTPTCGPLDYPDCQSVTEIWETPTTNTDGTELDFNDISHFNLYIGTDLDALDLYARLARSFNEFTVSNLDPALTHYVAVTCVSRSGVESYPCTRTAELGSNLFPQIPQNLAASFPMGLNGIRMTWDQVTEFETGGPITTQVTYSVYRDTDAGFTPDDDNFLNSIQVTTQYDDTTLVDCEQYYYKLTATACGNEGQPTADMAASLPSPPSCPSAFAGNVGAAPGTVDLSWDPPTTRMDGTLLDPGEIEGYKVLYDSLPGFYANELDVPDGGATSATVTGLALCTDYYFNIRAYNTCPALGDLCPSNEIQLHTAQPCDPMIPSVPQGVVMVPLDDRINLTWDANPDCDLYGYRVYYGTETGGPYTGVGAAEGNSPVEIPKEDVTVGDQCVFTLTNLQECQGYYVVVSAIDLCSPANESAQSAEVGGSTDCTPCQLEACCIEWLSQDAAYTDVNLEVYTLQATDEPLTGLTPTWTLGRNVLEVHYGRPLTKIWAHDGSAGADGAVGPQPSGAALDVDDVDVDGWTDSADGQPLRLVFDGDMRGDDLELEFRSLGNICTSAGTVEEGVLFENLDDGAANGWTFHSGTWSVTGGELYQSASSGNALASDPTSTCADFVYSAKLNVTYGQTPFIVFRMQNTSNYYMAGLRTSDNVVRIARVKSGAFSTRASTSLATSNNTWYNMTVRCEGNQIDVYVDCNLVLSHTDSEIWASGTLGLRASSSRVYYDDLRAVEIDVSGL